MDHVAEADEYVLAGEVGAMEHGAAGDRQLGLTAMALPLAGPSLLRAYIRDYPVIMAVTLTSAVIVMLANLASDIAYGFVDPRVRYD